MRKISQNANAGWLRRLFGAPAFALSLTFAFFFSLTAVPAFAGPPADEKAEADPPPDGEQPADGEQPPADGEQPADGDQPAGPDESGENLAAPKAAPDQGARLTEVYGDRVDTLQRDVDSLKDRVFRSKARLALLKETVLSGVLSGTRVIVAHRNLMGSQFKLTKITFFLDGAQIFARTDDSGAMDSEDEMTIYDGNVTTGTHTLTVEMTYKGNGFGIFSYLNGYTFESRSTKDFVATESGGVKLMSIGFERGNLTTEMKDRPAVDWQSVELDPSGKPLPKSAQKKSADKKPAKDGK